jgi:hypothetical protein
VPDPIFTRRAEAQYGIAEPEKRTAVQENRTPAPEIESPAPVERLGAGRFPASSGVADCSYEELLAHGRDAAGSGGGGGGAGVGGGWGGRGGVGVGGDWSSRWLLPSDEWETQAVNYTSGTTGRPKGVLYRWGGEL